MTRTHRILSVIRRLLLIVLTILLLASSSVAGTDDKNQDLLQAAEKAAFRKSNACWMTELMSMDRGTPIIRLR
jgi:ABC-type antimicrobial peptide transport system permease subunit